MKKFCLVLVCSLCAIIILPLNASSQPKKEDFEKWLEKYGAWDRLEKEYAAEKDTDSPEMILKRAEVYLNLNSPKQALEIIEMTPAFADNATEADRLFIGGKAHRAMGDLSKAVLWFTQSAKFTNNTSVLKHRFKAEPGLESIWADVWLKLYWSYLANHTISRESQLEALTQIMETGNTIWGEKQWNKARLALNPVTTDNATALAPAPPIQVELGPDGLPLPPLVSESDTKIIAMAMAQVSLEKFDDARERITVIKNKTVSQFWLMVVNYLEAGTQPTDFAVFQSGNYLKANAFWAGNILAPYSASRSPWVLGNPESGPWTKFRNNLLTMSPDDATKAINNELGSMLISEKTATLLTNFKLALAMANGDYATATSAWNKIDKKSLPLALQLSGILFFKENLNNVLPEKPADSFIIYPIFCALSGAAGYDQNSRNEAPFWISAPVEQLKTLSTKTWPMDKLILLAYWQQKFAKKPTDELAKRAAFLFDDTSFGVESMLHLADITVRAKKLQLGAFYLNRLQPESLSVEQKMLWLDVKIRLELDSGRTAAALKTFTEMNALGKDIPVMTRLRMALLFQQRRDFKTARDQLLTMWNNRSELTTTLQAETLFWLGEGEQALHNPGKALDYYLKLAWQYPQENIWALTAMYRASLIYEKRGKYDTAKRLLTTVVKRADRKEQREAAKARINAIDKKMGKTSSKKASTLVYPF